MTAPAASVGLTAAEAARRLVQYGANDPAPKRERSRLVELLLQFANPLVAILLFASIVSIFVGELVNALIIVVIVILSVAVNFYQTFRSRAAAERLSATVAPTATVLRDGVFGDVPRASVVPGDVIRLSAGDLVPADARLLQTTDLHVQESALTGESMPVEKEAKPGDESGATLVLLGTSVVSGTATALVLATGVKTQFGDIATRLRAKPPETEFDRGIKQFGRVRLGAFHLGGAHRYPPQRFRIRTVRGGSRRWPHTRISTHDHFGHLGSRRREDSQRASDRQTPVGDPKPGQHRRAVQRQDRHADPRCDGLRFVV